MSTAEVVTERPEVALARIVEPLDERRATALRESFGTMFDAVERWQAEASHLKVVAENETHKMERARLLRLEIRKARVSLDKRRKELKSGILLEGKAIDGAYNIFESLSSPLESFLLTQEQFAERAEEARRDALRDARSAALLALGVRPEALPAALGALTESAWLVILEDAKLAKQAREDSARREEETRVEAARIQAEKEAQRRAEQVRLEAERKAREEEQRAENERLRAEAVARKTELAAERARIEEERKAERVAAEAQRRTEAAAREKAERAAKQAEATMAAERAAFETKAQRDREEAEARARAEKQAADEAVARAEAEAARLREVEEERQRQEADAKKPTKAKYAIMVAALREIASLTGATVANDIANKALETIGENA